MRIRAFVFDDEAGVRTVLQRVLQFRGYEVYTFSDPGDFCADGLGLCDCAQSESCGHIILSDVRMPRVNGIEFLQQQVRRGCRVEHMALISGFWTPSTLQDARQLGCTIFKKPVRLAELSGWLDRCEEALHQETCLVDRFRPHA